MLRAEVLPLAPAIPAGMLAAVGLIAFLGFLLATGMLKVYAETIGALIRWLAHKIDVPVHVRFTTLHPLRSVSRGLLAVDTQIHNAFAYAALKSETAASWCFATAGHILRWTGDEIAALSRDTLSAFQRTATVDIPGAIRDAQAGFLTRLHGIDRLIGRVEAQAKAQLARLAHGIDRIDRIVTHTIPHAISGVTSRVGRLERGAKAQAGRLAHVEKALGAVAFAGAVGVALNRLGLRWLRCPALGRIGRKVGCGGFGLLETLLAESFTAFALLDLCRFADGVTRTAQALRPMLLDLVDVEEALIGCHGATAAPPLTLPTLVLAPKSAGLTLG